MLHDGKKKKNLNIKSYLGFLSTSPTFTGFSLGFLTEAGTMAPNVLTSKSLTSGCGLSCHAGETYSYKPLKESKMCFNNCDYSHFEQKMHIIYVISYETKTFVIYSKWKTTERKKEISQAELFTNSF